MDYEKFANHVINLLIEWQLIMLSTTTSHPTCHHIIISYSIYHANLLYCTTTYRTTPYLSYHVMPQPYLNTHYVIPYHTMPQNTNAPYYILCNTMPCHYAILYFTMSDHTTSISPPRHTMSYHTVRHYAIPYHSISSHTMPYHTFIYVREIYYEVIF